jgi:hypothetical protein
VQFKVPQNIDMEDKIIGPLTMKQFVYMLVGGMICYATIKSYNIILVVAVGIPAALLALLLTFIKIQDQPFSKFLLSLMMYLFRSRRRVWQKNQSPEEFKKPVVQKNKSDKDTKNVPKVVEKSELEKLSYILDTRGHEDVLEVQKSANAPIVEIKDKQKKNPIETSVKKLQEDI